MSRALAAASAAWTVAILAALAGVLLPSDRERVSLGLFASAVTLGLLVAVILVADGLRRRRARRLAATASASALRRLEHLPSVTTGTRRIAWRGSRALVGPLPAARPSEPVQLPGQVAAASATELTGSAR